MRRYHIILILLLSVNNITAQHAAIIIGDAPGTGRDSLTIILQHNPTIRQITSYKVPIVQGRFRQVVQLDKPVFCYIKNNERGFNALLEAGDSIHLNYPTQPADGLPVLNGKGTEKAAFLMDFREYVLYKKVRENMPRFKTTTAPFDSLFAFIDSVGQAFLRRLQSIRPSMSKESFRLLEAEILSSMWGQKYRGTTMLYNESIEQTLANRQKELTPRSKATLQNILTVDESLYYSHTYVNEVYGIFFRQYDGLVLDGLAGKNLTDKYTWLRKYISGRLQTPVLTLFLENDISKLNQAEDLEKLISETYVTPTDSIYRNYIQKYYSNVTSFKTGMPAPDFTLENEKGEKLNLAYFKGKVIYLDFWFATCGPCHALFSTIAPVKKHFSNRPDVIFLNVSIDPRTTWLDALKKHSIAGYHAYTEGKGGDHPITSAYKVSGYPTTCLIDRNGKIFLATPATQPQELMQQIEQALTH